MKIQCIGFFGHYYNKFVLDLEPSPEVQFKYRINSPSPMFRESYVGKDVRKDTLKFIEEQVKICYELAAFGGPEDQIHSIEELQKIAIGFGFHGRPRQYIRYIIKDSAKFRLILKICCHIQKEQTNELRQKINKFEQNDFRQPKRFKSE